MYEPRKIHNVIHEMQRSNIDILGISDVSWSCSGNFFISYSIIYFSGNQQRHQRFGVALIVSNFLPISDRIQLLQLRTKTANTNVIQIYAPTAEKSDEEVEQF